MLFYSDVQSAVNVNGHISSFFSLSRGVHQGCPLSPLWYVLVAEVSASSIQANPHITGFSLPGFSSSLPLFLNMPMIRPLLLFPIVLLMRFLMFTISIEGGRGPNLIS